MWEWWLASAKFGKNKKNSAPVLNEVPLGSNNAQAPPIARTLPADDNVIAADEVAEEEESNDCDDENISEDDAAVDGAEDAESRKQPGKAGRRSQSVLYKTMARPAGKKNSQTKQD